MSAFALALGCVAAAGGGASASAVANDPRAIVLVDQTGAAFRLFDLGGRPTLVTFVATRCTDACPIANAAFFRLSERLRRDRVDAQLLTITLDPVYDTPYVMSGIARHYHADAVRWRLASGKVADVRRLMSALGVVAQPDAKGIPEVHSSFVYLLDEHVRLAKTFLLSSNLVDEGEQALRSLPSAKRVARRGASSS